MRYSALSVKEKLQGAAAEHPLGSLVGKLELFWIHEPGRLDLVDHCPDSGDQRDGNIYCFANETASIFYSS